MNNDNFYRLTGGIKAYLTRFLRVNKKKHPDI